MRQECLIHLARTNIAMLTIRIENKLKYRGDQNKELTPSELSTQCETKAREIAVEIVNSLNEAGYLRDDVDFTGIKLLYQMLEIVESLFNWNINNGKNYAQLEILEEHINTTLLNGHIENKVYETFDFAKANCSIPILLGKILSPSQRELMNWYNPIHSDKTIYLSQTERGLIEAGCNNLLHNIDNITELYRLLFHPALSKSTFR